MIAITSQHYVVDASIVIQHLITDTYTPNADAFFAQLQQDDKLYVPEFCLMECTNVLWKQVRFHGMPQMEAAGLCDDLLALQVELVPVARLLKRSLQIGLAHQLAVYDSLYIAIAERLSLPLITTDRKQEAAARTLGITITPITAFK